MNTLKNLQNLRNEVGYSQEGMAKHLGVSLSFYEKVECGRMKASRAFMEKVKGKFPTASIDQIFFDTQQQL
jgi:DNA-binding XRE family transcriptional regulator